MTCFSIWNVECWGNMENVLRVVGGQTRSWSIHFFTILMVVGGGHWE